MNSGQSWKKNDTWASLVPVCTAAGCSGLWCSMLTPSGITRPLPPVPPARPWLALEFALEGLSRSAQRACALGNWESPWPSSPTVISPALALSPPTWTSWWKFSAALAFEEPTFNEGTPGKGGSWGVIFVSKFLEVPLSYEQSLKFGLTALWMCSLYTVIRASLTLRCFLQYSISQEAIFRSSMSWNPSLF